MSSQVSNAPIVNALWSAVLRARALLKDPERLSYPLGIRAAGNSSATLTQPDDPCAVLVGSEVGEWRLRHDPVDEEARQLEALYLPLLSRDGWCVAHLGQGLDGNIATSSGASHYVTGQENLIHLHRMRALCDVVVVGAETVRCDNPRLTTRLVPGENPVRAVIDPRGTLPAGAQVFDEMAQTLVLCDEAFAATQHRRTNAELIALQSEQGRLSPKRVVDALRKRGLSSIFVEGGGRTVSQFLSAGAVHRLQIAVGPMIIGGGRPGLTLPTIDTLEDAIRGKSRHFPMGPDVLFELDLGVGPEQAFVA